MLGLMPTQKQKKKKTTNKQTNKLTGKSPRRAWQRLRLHYSGSIFGQHRNLLVIAWTTEWFMSQASQSCSGTNNVSRNSAMCLQQANLYLSWDAINESFPEYCVNVAKTESLREAMWKAMGCLGCCIKEEIKRWRTYVPSAISFLSPLRIS